MTDERSLLAAILAHPDEDTPRLMLADWLQEHGQDARAEFIRVQCEIARLRNAPYPDTSRDGRHDRHCQRKEGGKCRAFKRGTACARCNGIAESLDRGTRIGQLMRREQELLVESAKSARYFADPSLLTYWLRGRPAGLPADRPDALVGLFVRGFIERVDGPADDWLTHADQILAAHPVRKVKLTTWPEWDWCDLQGRARWLPWVMGETPMRLRGRKWAPVPYEAPAAHRIARLLHAEWPGITFELPDTYIGTIEHTPAPAGHFGDLGAADD